MAPPSSNPLWKHDVFLSFCGRDTRKTFVSHLYRELDSLGIKVFKDDDGLERGAYINTQLIEAIRESRFAIVIISKNYASSIWCLKELEEIIECNQKGSLTVILPIFYEIDPSNVRKQRGRIDEAFKKHEIENLDNVERWKQALTRVANIAGEDSRKWRDESKLIERISTGILDWLNSTLPNDCSHLVGMDAHIEAIEPLLSQGSSDEVCMVGICGMGGIGKTTIAKCIYQRLYYQFQACCFIDNVREKYKNYGLSYLQEHLLSEILKKRDLKLPSIVEGSDIIKARLRQLKVLIALDDVDRRDQINALVGNTNWFGPGSKIIITSRETGLLSTWKVYTVRYLSDDDAIKLFSQFAFGKKHPEEEYLELSIRAIKYAGGLPLAIKVWGSHLNGMSKGDWEIAQIELAKSLHGDITRVLRVSYDGIEEQAKDIFLYIACFFKGEKIDRVARLLNNKYSNVEFWVRVLAKKSLVDVSPNGFVSVHDLLQEMAREITKQDQPGKQKFLMDPTEIYDVLTDFTGTESVEGISLDLSKINGLILTDQAFERMPNLRFLKFYDCGVHYRENTSVQAEGLNYLPRKLVAVLWDHYPFHNLPSKFHPECLVELRMPFSNLVRFWEGAPALINLKKMVSYDSKNLKAIPDLSMCPKLEVLDLGWCRSLVEVSSIENLQKLIYLDFTGCDMLECLPNLCNMSSLKYLSLRWCKRIKTFPQAPSSIKRLHLDYTAIEEVPPSVGHLSSLVHLIMCCCASLRSIPSNIEHLSNLEELDLSSCVSLTYVPKTIQKMRSLKCLRLRNCNQLKSLPRPPNSLLCFTAHDCSSVAKVTRSSSLPFDLGVLNNSLKLRGNQQVQQLESFGRKGKEPLFAALLPGCEVPECFSYQARGSSLTISMPRNRRFVGFLACMVMATEGNYHGGGIFKIECWLSPRNRTKNALEPSAHNCVNQVIPESGSAARDSADRPLHQLSYNPRAIGDHLVHKWQFSEIGKFHNNLLLLGWYFDEPEEYTKMVIIARGEFCDRSRNFRVEECGVCPIFMEDLVNGENTGYTAPLSFSYSGSTRRVKPMIQEPAAESSQAAQRISAASSSVPYSFKEDMPSTSIEDTHNGDTEEASDSSAPFDASYIPTEKQASELTEAAAVRDAENEANSVVLSSIRKNLGEVAGAESATKMQGRPKRRQEGQEPNPGQRDRCKGGQGRVTRQKHASGK